MLPLAMARGSIACLVQVEYPPKIGYLEHVWEFGLRVKSRHFRLNQGAETGVLLRSYFVVAALNEDFSNAE